MSVTAMRGVYRAERPATRGLSAGHGSSAAENLPGPADCRMHPGPWRLVRRELPPQVPHKLGDLAVGHAVLEGGHVAEIARRRGGDAMQDHLDQIVRCRAVQVAVQRQRGAATEQ